LEGNSDSSVMFKPTVGALIKLETFSVTFGTDGLDLLKLGKSSRIS